MDEIRQAARRLIRTNLQKFVCEQMNNRQPDNVWRNLLWLAKGFEKDAKEEWQAAIQRKGKPPLTQIVPEALSKAVENATLPYENTVPSDVLEQLVQQYVDNFDGGEVFR